MKSNRLLGMLAGFALSAGTVPAIEPGEKAPGFSLKNTDGEQVSLDDYEGQVVVLEWTNYDCPFVKKHYASGNMPMLQQKYRDEDVAWLVVNSSAEGKQGYLSPSELGARSDKEGSKASHVLLDPSGTVGKAYGAQVTPHMFVIDREGKVAFAGGIDDKPTVEVEDIDGANNYVAAAVEAVLEGEKPAVQKAKPYGCGVKY